MHAIYPSSIEVVRNAVMSLKNNEVPGKDVLPGEIYKASLALVKTLTNLLSKVWGAEYVPQDWRIATIISVLKRNEGDRKNWQGVSIIKIAGKFFCNNYSKPL
jgi:hypothetical protein